MDSRRLLLAMLHVLSLAAGLLGIVSQMSASHLLSLICIPRSFDGYNVYSSEQPFLRQLLHLPEATTGEYGWMIGENESFGSVE